MRRLLLLLLGCSLAALAAGPPRQAEARPRPTFLYVHNYSNPNRVYGYRFLPSGEMDPLPNFPILAGETGEACNAKCNTMAYSRRRQLLFTTGASGVTTFRIGADGALTQVGTAVGGVQLMGVAVVESGAKTFVYGADVNNNQLRGFEAQRDGTLVQLASSPFAAGTRPTALKAAGKYVFATNTGSTPSISSYVATASGSLTAAPGSPSALPAGMVPQDVQTVSNGRLIYVSNSAGGTVAGYAVNTRTAALAALSGSPFSTDLANTRIGVTLGSSPYTVAFADVVQPEEGQVPDYRLMRRLGNGRLTAVGSPRVSPLGSNIDVSEWDPSQRYLVMTNDVPEGPSLVCSFTVNRRNGDLRLIDPEELEGNTDFSSMVFAQR